MIVSLSYHASQRINQRFNSTLAEGARLDLTNKFILTRQYRHDLTGRWVSSWLCANLNRRCMLIVDEELQLVITVMSAGPVVDAAYHQCRGLLAR